MRKCKKCGVDLPQKAWIDGKKRNLQRRKYCTSCSLFGHHNTRKLEVTKGIKVCPDCKESHNQKGHRCFRCYFRKRSKIVSSKIAEIVGIACWICGYDKTKRNLHFHHVDRNTKKFELTSRELMLKWDRVFEEMKKCVFVCANCHGEIHAGLVNEQYVISIWKSYWKDS